MMRVVLLAMVMLTCGAARAADRPNVIIILCDDLGYGDVGAYGQKKIRTPNIDRLAAEGMRFTQHYAGSTVCAPSRACLLTGQHTGHTAVRGNPSSAVKKTPGDTPLPADTFTFAKLFNESGYTTAIIGKWGMGHPGTSGEPSKQGFDYFFGHAGHRDAHEYYPPHLWRNAQKLALDGTQYAHDLIAEEALRWLRDHAVADKPFMLYLTFTIPHAKLQVPDLAPYENEDWPDNEKKFAAMMTRLDASVGQVLDLLQELKLDEKTLVIFTSDNGPHTEGGHDPDFFDSNGPLRGIKRDMYEGGIRVPFIARWPGKIAAGSKSEHVAAFWDFLPTAAELLQVKISAVDGISYLPTLLGHDDRQSKHEHLYWEFQERGGKQAVRFGNWKGIRLDVSSNADAPIELYDLSTDLAETNNLAARHPDLVAQAATLMHQSRRPSENFPLLPEEKKKVSESRRPRPVR